MFKHLEIWNLEKKAGMDGIHLVSCLSGLLTSYIKTSLIHWYHVNKCNHYINMKYNPIVFIIIYDFKVLKSHKQFALPLIPCFNYTPIICHMACYNSIGKLFNNITIETIKLVFGKELLFDSKEYNYWNSRIY